MNGSRGRAGLWLILAIVVALIALGLHSRGFLQPVEAMLSQLLLPVQAGLSRAAAGLGDMVAFWQELGNLRQENRQLREENERLRAWYIQLLEAANENRTLREQLGFRQAFPSYDLLPAEVIGKTPNNFATQLTVAKGSNDGVQEGAVVVFSPPASSQGEASPPLAVIGRVIAVSPATSRILLVTDPSSSVNGLVQGSRALGVVSGSRGGRLTMRYIPQGESISVGDLILTSGLGGNFPRGLPLGTVISVRQKDIELFQEAEVLPAVNMDRLEIVFIIRNFIPTPAE